MAWISIAQIKRNSFLIIANNEISLIEKGNWIISIINTYIHNWLLQSISQDY